MLGGRAVSDVTRPGHQRRVSNFDFGIVDTDAMLGSWTRMQCWDHGHGCNALEGEESNFDFGTVDTHAMLGSWTRMQCWDHGHGCNASEGKIEMI